MQESNKHLFWQDSKITLAEREASNGHKSAIFWLTGFSGAGKSTVGTAIEKLLFKKQFQTVLLDGDNVRHGLCNDLTFSDEDRTENIRRVGEMAKILMEYGNIVICTFISPFIKDRHTVRSITPSDKFFEVYINCSIEECKRRDTKGLYKKAIEGKIPKFTGISSPYEPPLKPDITLNTGTESAQDSVSILLKYILEKTNL